MPYKDPEKYKEYQREYQKKNRERLLSNQRTYYVDHKEELAERSKEYYEKNRESLLAASKEYYQENKDIIGERNKKYYKEYYQKNKEVLLKYASEHVKKHRERYTKHQREKRAKRGEWLWELKCGLSCVNCGENHPACLDFHHRDSATKDGLISKAITEWSLERVLEEIEKCDILCSNCHRKFHCKRKWENGRINGKHC